MKLKMFLGEEVLEFRVGDVVYFLGRIYIV